MPRLFLTEPVECEKDGKEILLNQPIYNVSDIKWVEKNFHKCNKCKDYFGTIWEVTKYNPLFEKYGDKQYCETCFQTLA